MDHVLETVGRGVAVFGEVGFVIGIAREVHAACVPIAVFGFALRAPVGPDAEFGVAKPIGCLVVGEGIPIRFERAVRNGWE